MTKLDDLYDKAMQAATQKPPRGRSHAGRLTLTTAQIAFLRALAEQGESRRPWGYRTAGRDAANWDRTVAVLERHGLVTSRRHGQWVSVILTLPAPVLA